VEAINNAPLGRVLLSLAILYSLSLLINFQGNVAVQVGDVEMHMEETFREL
jgi:hypothetical protein